MPFGPIDTDRQYVLPHRLLRYSDLNAALQSWFLRLQPGRYIWAETSTLRSLFAQRQLITDATRAVVEAALKHLKSVPFQDNLGYTDSITDIRYALGIPVYGREDSKAKTY